MIEILKNDNWERLSLLVDDDAVFKEDETTFDASSLVLDDQDMFSMTLAKNAETSASESGNA